MSHRCSIFNVLTYQCALEVLFGFDAVPDKRGYFPKQYDDCS